jgi:DNA-binding NarL/FixJ family response regulator
VTRLTPRELEVAGLMSHGLSNRQIATRLLISQRTAESHVENILGKLGFTSRVEVVTWMTRQRTNVE